MGLGKALLRPESKLAPLLQNKWCLPTLFCVCVNTYILTNNIILIPCSYLASGILKSEILVE